MVEKKQPQRPRAKISVFKIERSNEYDTSNRQLRKALSDYMVLAKSLQGPFNSIEELNSAVENTKMVLARISILTQQCIAQLELAEIVQMELTRINTGQLLPGSRAE